MKCTSFARITGVAIVTLAIAITQAVAQSPSVPIRADELTGALSGKVCTTAAGAKFAFSKDGHYAYEGLWTSRGHYSVGDGAIYVLLDHGLGKSFAFMKKEDVLYMERIALSCGPS